MESISRSPKTQDAVTGRRAFLWKAATGAATLLAGGKARIPARAAVRPVHLDFVVWSYGVETVLDNINNFEKAHSGTIDVTLSDFSWNAYHETMVNRLRTNTPTDVMYNGGDWLPEFAAAGWVVPLEDHFPKAVEYYKPKIVGYAVQDMTYRGKLYGLPYYADITTFQYNRELAKESGVDRPPADWDELTEMALTLQKKGIETPILLEFAQDLPTSLEDFTAMVFGRGGELFDEQFNPLFSDPASPAFQQLQWMVDAIHRHRIASIMPHETNIVRAMNTGRHVYTVLYNYNLAALNNPGISPRAGQFDIAPMPGKTHETYGFAKFYNLTKMVVQRGRGVVDAAIKFIEYFGGEYQGQYRVAKRWAVEHGLGFGQLPLYDDPEVKASLSKWVSVPLFRDQQELARARRQTVWYGIWSEFMRVQMARALAGEVGVKEALEAAAQRANQLKRQFKT